MLRNLQTRNSCSLPNEVWKCNVIKLICIGFFLSIHYLKVTLKKITLWSFHLISHICLFLPSGALNATVCPRGTINNNTGGASINDCYPCLPGHYCSEVGSYEPTGVCAERYYCPDIAKIETSMPSNYVCPAGFYCPLKTATPIACPPGRSKVKVTASLTLMDSAAVKMEIVWLEVWGFIKLDSLELPFDRYILNYHHKISWKSLLIQTERLCAPHRATILLWNAVKIISIAWLKPKLWHFKVQEPKDYD